MKPLKHNVITSESNSMIKHIKSLAMKKNREKNRQFVIEGLRMVDEAIRHRVPLDYILYSDHLLEINGGQELLKQIPNNYQVFSIPDNLLGKLTDTENPQGVVAVAKMPEISFEDLKEKENLFVLVLDRLQDPGNMGTIIRTAEAAKVDAVILTKGSVDPYNSKTLRATMGAIFHLPVIQCDDNQEWLSFAQDKGIRILASGLEGGKDYSGLSYAGSIAIIIGNEANGVEAELLKSADAIVKIPILGKIESLNASIAAGILIYKAVEFRGFLKD